MHGTKKKNEENERKMNMEYKTTFMYLFHYCHVIFRKCKIFCFGHITFLMTIYELYCCVNLSFKFFFSNVGMCANNKSKTEKIKNSFHTPLFIPSFYSHNENDQHQNSSTIFYILYALL